MAKDDVLLQEKMGSLEIEPIKLNGRNKDRNPFMSLCKRGLLKRTLTGSCSCSLNKKNINNGICKKKQNKIIKEPVLNMLQNSVGSLNKDEHIQVASSSESKNINIDSLNLCTLVKNCNQLKISCDLTEHMKRRDTNNKKKWWKNDKSCTRDNREHKHSNQIGSCSQQALNPQCDITIDELASYFETLVHIPKKMSSMAEMMYI